ncbi:phospholipase C, phosphocholine-specific [Xanthomonas sp. AmX2]|uniref:phosphocholine-specific phospholipase C n=1 Tax=Xanthomonas sp. TaxID=29446 RepID=UPI001980BAC9|nr:phospholipase C, phosphocholine-specific [Xanthomonas sp.]MBN6152830.1 phospholipase C, phosphocholine-specific [Xanthomonas sp.]
MVEQGRRRFLARASLALGAGALSPLLPGAIRSALAVPPARVTGTLQDVQHVVILMQENRSFDHYFGCLRGVRGYGDPRPLRLPSGRPVWYQPEPGAADRYVLPFRLNSQTSSAQWMKDLNHDWKGSHETWKHHDAWIAQKSAMTMGHFQREDLPFYYALADAFTICDGYHASLFGPTNPNRMYLFTGTSGLTVGDDGEQAVNNRDDGNWTADMARDNPQFPGHAWTTYSERLQQAGVSWQVYQEFDNYGDNSHPYFARFRNLDRDSPLYRRGRAWVPGSTADNAKASRGEHLVAAFARDVRQGTLPQVSWIVAPYLLSEHPEATPAYGQSLSARLLEALAGSPEVWSKTVFLINYDENDGFFDHVPPALPAIAPALGASNVDTRGEDYHGVPVGLGPRVPMLVVSPWSRGGWVDSQVFDHTSVIRFLERRFGVVEPNIGAWRRAVAGDLTSALDFSGRDDRRTALPDTGGYIARIDATAALPPPQRPAQQALPRQEPGQRPARALPYDFDVTMQADSQGRALWMRNRGAAGVALNAYADGGVAGPWFYTLAAGSELRDTRAWRGDAAEAGYALQVHGPNGFLREFQGDGIADAGLEADSVYDAQAQCLLLTLRNGGTQPCSLRIRDGYRGVDRQQALAAGESAVLRYPLQDHHHWYDLTLSSDAAPRWRRRLAGHIETGRPSMSDPAIGTAVAMG